MELPTYMLETTPQNTSGWLTIINGPVCTPWTSKAVSSIADAGANGMPRRVRTGTP